ncbi:MAG: hypothetical protein ACYTAO_14195 [Planctomycetota bacterium]|jgi:hypothetical protein
MTNLRSLNMAGFEVTPGGRFCVTADINYEVDWRADSPEFHDV